MKSKVISRDMLLYTILLLSHILPSISFKFLTSRHGTSHTTTTASTSSSRSSSSSRRYGIHAPSSPLDSLLTLDIDSELLNRRIVPYHVTSPTDIFCNREVNMQQIEAVGFDMDYTLASYKVDFDLLAYDGAVDKLIHLQGYPSDILPVLQYEEGLCRRGCLIDKKKGNLLKLDQYRYVRIAQHGLTTFTREERKTKYREAFSMMETFNGPDFAYTDTPFSLVDATLYAQLVDLRDRVLLRTPVASTSSHTPPVGDIPHIAPSPKVDQYLDSLSTTQIQSLVTFFTSRSYYQLWLDMRKAIDRCHFDGAIKLKVAEDPARYIHYDPDCKSPLLHTCLSCL